MVVGITHGKSGKSGTNAGDKQQALSGQGEGG